MSELTYYVATSLDGFIAREDGSFDGFDWDDEVVADFLSDLEGFGTVLMGRNTYEAGLNEGKTNPYLTMRQILFSRTMVASPDKAVELVQRDISKFVKDLKAVSEKPIWLCGGADVATTLMNEDLIDRVVVKLNPVIFGTGIPIFGENVCFYKLNLQETKLYHCGIVLLSYKVKIALQAT